MGSPLRVVYLVYILQRIQADYAVPWPEIFVGGLEIGHGESPQPEMEGHEAVDVLRDLRLGESAVPDTFLGKYVVHLQHLEMKVQPPLGDLLY